MGKENDEEQSAPPIRLVIITTAILTVIWILMLDFLFKGCPYTEEETGCQKKIEELQIEYQARQSTYEMDYRTCETRLGEMIEENE